MESKILVDGFIEDLRTIFRRAKEDKEKIEAWLLDKHPRDIEGRLKRWYSQPYTCLLLENFTNALEWREVAEGFILKSLANSYIRVAEYEAITKSLFLTFDSSDKMIINLCAPSDESGLFFYDTMKALFKFVKEEVEKNED